LGLGGEPKLLGRASDVETFIANGEDESDIEIELVNAQGGENPIVRREIRKSTSPKSSFFWNGKQCTAKSIKQKCLEEYQITVDNLCTFLPQDKVGNFSGFDSKQLLIETEKALTSSQKHYHTHMELIKQQEEMQGGENRRETLEDRLRHLETEGKRLERAKDLMEERDTAVQQSDLLRKKTMWLEFDEKVALANHKKGAQKDLKVTLRELSETLAPLEAEYEAAQQHVTKFTGDLNRLDDEIRQATKEMNKQIEKSNLHGDKIDDIRGDIELIAQQRAISQGKVDALREKIEGYNAQLKELPALETLKDEELKCREDYKNTQAAHKETTNNCQSLLAEFNEIQDELTRKKTKAASHEDEKERRKERIFRQQPNLKRISDWLRQNREKFRKDVFGPVVCDVTPKDANTAAYLEMHVPNAALKSFVVQCKEDYDLLYRSIREELGIPINVTVIERIKQEKRLYSDQKMQVLKREHGVLGYMDETIEAPPLIIEALKNAGQIEKVLIGSEKTQDSLDTKGLLDYLGQQEDGQTALMSSCIFSTKGDRGFKYQTVISKYSGKASTRIDSVRPAKWLAPGVSDQEKERLQAELAEITRRYDESKPAVAEARQKLAETEGLAQEAREKLKLARENLSNLGKLQGRKDTTEAKLREAEKELGVDGDAKKKGHIDQLEKRIHASLQALEAHSESYKKMMKATIKSTGIRLNMEAAKAVEIRLRYVHLST
jgi:chromosome segregation ATPase